MLGDKPRQFMEVLDLVIAEDIKAAHVFGAYKRLSCTLVGSDELEDWLARAYLGVLIESAADGPEPASSPVYRRVDLLATLEKFRALEKQAAGDAMRLRGLLSRDMVLLQAPAPISVVTKAIVALWYCAGLIDQTLPAAGGMGFVTKTAPSETYPKALVWAAIGGNPMGVPGPYYGNWAYPSPTLIAPPQTQPDEETTP